MGARQSSSLGAQNLQFAGRDVGTSAPVPLNPCPTSSYFATLSEDPSSGILGRQQRARTRERGRAPWKAVRMCKGRRTAHAERWPAREPERLRGHPWSPSRLSAALGERGRGAP